VSPREEEIRRVVAELDIHMANAEASIAVLKALVAGDDSEALGEEDPS
jgi:hypothetical protein